VVVLLVRLAPAPEDAARLVKAPEVDELEVGSVRVEVVAAGKEVDEVMPPRLSPVDEVLVNPPRFSPKPAADVVAAGFDVAAAEVKLKPGVEAVLALLELKPPRLKFKVGADEAVVVVAAPPVAARGQAEAWSGGSVCAA